jgi:hypothetical protein
LHCIALHGMTYYIFLKSLRSLEEFRKNPHDKIPPTNFQSLCIFKNPIFIQKEFLFEKNFSSPVLARSSPQATARACSAHPGLRGLGVIAKSHLYFEFAQPDDDTFSLCHRQAGPTHQLHLPPSAGRSRPCRRLTSPLSTTPCHPASTSRC